MLYEIQVYFCFPNSMSQIQGIHRLPVNVWNKDFKKSDSVSFCSCELFKFNIYIGMTYNV